jgi:hypothetical protein
MKRLILVILFNLFFISCFSSSVVKVGPDTYSYSTQAGALYGGEQKAVEKAISEANVHCSKLGNDVLINNISSSTDRVQFKGLGRANVIFQCLVKDDPSLVRPTFQQTPNVVIEDRRN